MSLRPNARTEVRRNRYKVAVDAEEGRRRREDNMVEIRKNRREESLQKKRREGMQAQQFPASIHQSAVEKKVFFSPDRIDRFILCFGFRVRVSVPLDLVLFIDLDDVPFVSDCVNFRF